MQVVNDARGSLWRRWDLHVHTPASLYHNYGSGRPVPKLGPFEIDHKSVA